MPNRDLRHRKREALKPNGKPCSAQASWRTCPKCALHLWRAGRIRALALFTHVDARRIYCATRDRSIGLTFPFRLSSVKPPASARYASAVNIRGASGKADGADDFWNFEQLQREKAMLAEEVARLAQTCQAANSEKSRLAQAAREKDKRIAFLHEEKDMLTQVRSCCSCRPCHPRSFCCWASIEDISGWGLLRDANHHSANPMWRVVPFAACPTSICEKHWMHVRKRMRSYGLRYGAMGC
jgi:hypothetical protein